MGPRASLSWIVGACVVCVVSVSCGGSGTSAGDPSAGNAGRSGASGSSGGRGGRGGADLGGGAGDPSDTGNAGSNDGGDAAAGDDSGSAGQGGASDGGAAAEGGAAGEPAAPPRFEPWALWPMPNAASAGLPNPASYDTATPGVVRDELTGLVWQVSVSASTYTWEAARAFCAKLELAGFDDWRLPSRIELISIVDYTIAKPGPVIDTAAFPDAPNSTFWTASPLARYGTSRAWYVEFDNGFAFNDSTDVEYSARCVR